MRRLLAPAFVLFAACKDVSSWSTAPGESWCGNIVEGGFVRAAFTDANGTTYLGPNVQVRMTFDADQASGTPGRVTTSDGLLRDAPLTSLPQEFSDPISTLQFGEGRRKNFLYFVEPANGGGAIAAVVSLLESGNAELRLIRTGSSASNAPAFAVFPLVRQTGACGFDVAPAPSTSSS